MPESGFTLIELMVTVGILAILIGIAAPSFRDAVLSARMTALTNDLMADLNLARAESVRRNLNVYVCASANGLSCNGTTWNDGWIVWVDLNNSGTQNVTVPTPNAGEEVPLKSRTAVAAGMNIRPTNDLVVGAIHQVFYGPTGVMNGRNALTPIIFSMCDSRNTAVVGAVRAENKGRNINIEVSGRPLVTRQTCATATS